MSVTSEQPVQSAGVVPFGHGGEGADDESLLERCAHGDSSALAELYDRYGRVAYGLAFRVLRDAQLAEDAVQDGYLAVWGAARTYAAGRGKARTWILTLVHRRAVDLVRREERRRADELTEVHEPGEAESRDPGWLRWQRRLVQDAIRSLPPEQREAIELAYYGGYTQSELAARLGVPLGTIKSRTFAGLGRLRALLCEAGLESVVD